MNPHTITSENLKIKKSQSDNRSFGVGVKTLTINLIRLYQIIFSPNHGLGFFAAQKFHGLLAKNPAQRISNV